MIDEQLAWPTYERISKVLRIFCEDPQFFPHQQDFEDINPTHDPQRRKIHKIEACWEWRNRVINAMRTTSEIYWWETLHSGRYLTKQEKYYFLRYWRHDEWSNECAKAIKKIDNNFARFGVYWE